MVYAASCNPPRRAKRQRTGSLVGVDAQQQQLMPAPPTAILPASAAVAQQRRANPRPPILPKQPATDREYATAVGSPDSESGSDEEDDYDPGRDAAPAPKRRGRKPGTMSRSARESLRKLNHSRIEKARRTKINETLSVLSTHPSTSAQTEPEAPTVPAEDKAKKEKGEDEK